MAKEIQDEVSDFFADDENKGVATVAEVAQMIDLDEQEVRRHARANKLRRVGAQFVYTEEDVHELLDALDDEDAEADEEAVDEEE